MAEPAEIQCVAFNALDYFEETTIPVSAWVHHGYDEAYDNPGRLSEFIKAIVIASAHPFWSGPLRGEPRVAYNPATDTHFFIIKIDNNGTTFVVGEGVAKFGGEA